jgi:hypothetical protein
VTRQNCLEGGMRTRVDQRPRRCNVRIKEAGPGWEDIGLSPTSSMGVG